MTELDVLYFDLCYSLGLIGAPLLEVGSGKVHGSGVPNVVDLARSRGIQGAIGADVRPGEGVGIVQDFTLRPEGFSRVWGRGKFATVVCFNLLEHTFDPVAVLINALSCCESGGTLVVTAPAVWPLHDFPRDYLRLMPHWYEEFGRRTGLVLEERVFCWLSSLGIARVGELLRDGQYELPTYRNMGREREPVRYWSSRVVQRLFNTFGRTHFATHAAIGAAYRVPAPTMEKTEL